MTRRTAHSVKTLRGTARADRPPHEPAAGERILIAPEAPSDLTAAAAAEWSRLASVLVELGVLTRPDLRALELLSSTLASEKLFAAAIAADGVLIDSGGSRKAHPALAGLATARSQARALLRDFGLVPAARSDVKAAPAAPTPDPLDEFRRDPLDEFRRP